MEPALRRLHPTWRTPWRPGVTFIELLERGLAAGDYPDAEGREAGMARGAPGAPRARRRRARAGAVQRALGADRGAGPGLGRPHQRAGRHHRAEAARGLLPPAVRGQSDRHGGVRRADLRGARREQPPPRRSTAIRASRWSDAPRWSSSARRIAARGRGALRIGPVLRIPRRSRPGPTSRPTAREIEVLPYMQTLTYGGPAAVMAALVDVSDAKAAEAELKRTRAFLDAVIETMPTMLWSRTRSSTATSWSTRPGEELLGMSRAEHAGQDRLRPLPEGAGGLLRRVRQGCWPSHEVATIDEEPIHTRDKGERWLRPRRSPCAGPTGGPSTCWSSARTSPSAGPPTQALTEARDAAEAANRAKSDFLANMSHEIRTPLNGVIGVADMLARTRLDRAQREMVEMVRSSGETLERLLSDVLDLARVESGQLEHRRPSPSTSATRCATWRASAGPRAEAKGVGAAPGDRPRSVDRLGLRRRACACARSSPTWSATRSSSPRRARSALTPRAGGGADAVRFDGRATPASASTPSRRRAVRPLPAGGRLDHPPVRRHGPGPGHLARAGRADGRRARLRERAGPGLDLHLPCEPAAGRGAAGGAGRGGSRPASRRATRRSAAAGAAGRRPSGQPPGGAADARPARASS